MEKYTFSILGDFPNQKVNIGSLKKSIDDSAISSSTFSYIGVAGDVCDIFFDDALSGGDQTTLDGIVATHDGEPFSPFFDNRNAFNDFLKLYPIFLISVNYNDKKTGVEILDYALGQGDITQGFYDWIMATFSNLS